MALPLIALGAIAAAASAAGSALQGKKPKVPAYAPTDTGKVQQETIADNMAALPGDIALARRTNAANQEDILNLLRQGTPGYDAITQTTSNRIQDYLKGIVPEDVSQGLVRNAAARSLAGGYGGSGMFRNLGARDLGRTSDDYIRYGIGAGQQFVGNQAALTMPQRYNAGQGFLDPQQTLQLRSQEAQQNWNRDWLEAQIKAQPKPWAKFLGDRLGGVSDAATGAAFFKMGGK